MSGADPDAPEPLERQAERFAQELNNTLCQTLGQDEALVNAQIYTRSGTSADKQTFRVGTTDPGVELRINGVVLFRLKVDFMCGMNSDQRFLVVNKSNFSLRVQPATQEERSTPGSGEPVLRMEYVKDARQVPVSHLNVHSHHPWLKQAMKRARNRSLAHSKPDRPEVLHIPTGGHRFRPSVEDLLEALIRDFGIDSAAKWEESLTAGRLQYKRSQLAAAITDDPYQAAAVMDDLGFELRWPADAPGPRPDRTGAN